jgi:predicted DNA-binding antitoxin AbrB/MazE fold protein
MTKKIEVIYENGVFRPLEPVELAEHQHATVTIPNAAKKQKPVPNGASCYELAKRAGIIGVVDGLPSDLSTNRDYFEGFGRD